MRLVLQNGISKSRGFTLLEILAAVAVLAIALSALVQTVSMNTKTVALLRDRTFAHWVAMNQITQLQIAESWPSTGTHNGKDEMAGKEWGWTLRITDTPNSTIRRIDVEVFQTPERKELVTALVGYLLQPGNISGQGTAVQP